jgi:hypothetical protein
MVQDHSFVDIYVKSHWRDAYVRFLLDREERKSLPRFAEYLNLRGLPGKTVRSLYNAYYGEDALKNPTAEEWAVFATNCNLRDMGTHLCALPTGEHCPKGLICLGCAHAQPKKSAVPIFRRMLASHERSLVAARGHSEPAGQIAAREMEIVRIKGALQRAEELSDDVAVAIERAL